MKFIMGIYIALILISTSLFSACKQSDMLPAWKKEPSLIVVEGAINVIYKEYKGVNQVTYDLNIDFPASDFIESISKDLAKKGWNPLKKDNLNLGISSSIERGWSEYIDKTKSNTPMVKQWITDWDNKNKDIVRYVLSYEYQKGNRNGLKRLKVVAIYMPFEIASNIQDNIKNAIPKNYDFKAIPQHNYNKNENINIYLCEASFSNGLKEVSAPFLVNKVYLHKDPEILPSDIAKTDKIDEKDGFVIKIVFNAEGQRKISSITKGNIGKRMAIYYNNKLISAPIIREAINSEYIYAGYSNKKP